MRFRIGKLVITATRDERCYEVQDSDADGRLAWFSGPEDLGHVARSIHPYMHRKAAVALAEYRPLPSGWKRVVRHVGDGTVVYRRRPVYARLN